MRIVACRRVNSIDREIEALVRAGEFERAIEAAASIEDKWRRSRVLSDIAGDIAEAGDPVRAGELIGQVLRDYGWWSSIGIGAALVKTYSRDMDGLRQTLSYIRNSREGHGWGQLALALARMGEEGMAVVPQVVATVERAESYKDEAFKAMSIAFASVGAWEQAVAMIDRIGDPDASDEPVEELGHYLARTATLPEALEVIEHIQSEFDRAWALITLGRDLTGAGEVDWAIRALRRAVCIAQRIAAEDPPERDELIRQGGTALARAGRLEEALLAAESIGDDSVQRATLLEITSSQERMG